MAITPQSAKDKKKKKHWYSVHATAQFQNLKLGETLAYTPQEIIGKVLKINLMTLTNDPKKQAVTLSFKIHEVNHTTGTALLTGYALNSAHLKRLVRKASNKIEDSFFVVTKDNLTFRIKPIIFTRYQVSNSLLTALRKKTQEIMQNAIRELPSVDVFTSLISNHLQMETKGALKKLYPISICDVKTFTLVSQQKIVAPSPEKAATAVAPVQEEIEETPVAATA